MGFRGSQRGGGLGQTLPAMPASHLVHTVFWCTAAAPRSIKDWDDLTKPGIQVIVVNQKLAA
jgi:ABC-type sulfate transport system substrate-binding protein